jgi:hypothetical protein
MLERQMGLYRDLPPHQQKMVDLVRGANVVGPLPVAQAGSQEEAAEMALRVPQAGGGSRVTEFIGQGGGLFQTAKQLNNAVILGGGKPHIQLQQRLDKQQEAWRTKEVAAAAAEAKGPGGGRALVLLRDIDADLLLRSDKSSSGFKGVQRNKGRYQATCDTTPCRHHHVRTCDPADAAAQATLQHGETDPPEELEKEQAPPLQVQEHILMRSDKASSGFKGVQPYKGRYKATCDTPPCRHHYLGMGGTPEEAAQAYLQHWEEAHPEELEKERQQGPQN